MKGCVALIVVLVVIFAPTTQQIGSASRSQERWRGSLGEFFSSVDRNRDGEIQPEEAASYLGDASVVDQDLQYMQANVDGADHGDTISEGELQRHLHKLLQVLLYSVTRGKGIVKDSSDMHSCHAFPSCSLYICA